MNTRADERCDVCGLRLWPNFVTSVRGHGDGRGQRFAHNDCYERERAEKAEVRLARTLEALRGLLEADDLDITVWDQRVAEARALLASVGNEEAVILR